MMKLSSVQLREKFLATGEVSEKDFGLYAAFADDPSCWAIYYATAGERGKNNNQCSACSKPKTTYFLVTL